MKALIAGAGIGGLSTALCLAKGGHQVVLFEQADEFTEVGAGLQFGANAVRVLQYLGVQSALAQVAVEPERVEFREYKTGKGLYEVVLGRPYAQRYGAPYYHLHRADVMRALVDQANASENIQICMGATVESYTETDSSVSIELAGDQQFKGDLLIACDGVKSLIRSQLLGDTQPRFTGNVAWRATVPCANLPPNFMRKVVTNFVGPKKHMVLYYVRNQQLLNMVGVVENSEWQNDSWVARASWQEFKNDFSGWHPMVTAAIDAVDKNACYRWALYDHKPFGNWSSKRVSLLGDAAHATLPFMASGAAMAVEDARILQRCLDAEHRIDLALLRYQNNRMARTAKIQNTSRRFGTLYHIRNPLLLKAAFAGLRMMGGKKEDFLPEYDANQVPLI